MRRIFPALVMIGLLSPAAAEQFNSWPPPSPNGGTPGGVAGGVLSGTYPNPGFAASPLFSGTLGLGSVASDSPLTINANTGTTVAPNAGTVIHSIGADGTRNTTMIDSFGDRSSIISRRANGTLASKTGIVANDTLLNIAANGWDTAAYGSGPNYATSASETWSASAHGSQSVFSVVPNTTTTLTAALILQNSGGVFIGNVATGLAANELGMAKIAASGTAPGVGTAKMAWLAGTNANTCKLIAYAGTSNTPVTIVDNVGAGC